MGAVAKDVKEPEAKGRGRPPKNGVAKPAYVPTGKPRGRPKGSGKLQKKAAAGKVAKPAGAKGSRGRPKKAEEEPAEDAE